MSEQTQPRRRSVIGSIFRGLDMSRKIILNVVFFFLLFAFLGAFADDTPIVPEKTALVIAPQGILVEQLSGDAVQRAIDKATDSYVPETLVDDVLDAIHAAETDDRIRTIYLNFDGLLGGGLDKVLRIATALEDFRATGKKVIANGDQYQKAGYLIATAADEVYVHDQGMVLLDGYSRFRMYHRDAIERLGVQWNVFKVGTYKSAVEPYLRNDMSEAAEEANLEFLDDIWSAYLDHLAASRGLERAQVEADIAQVLDGLREANGSMAQMAVDNGWVDGAKARNEVRQRMIELVGETEEGGTFNQIRMGEYLLALGEERHRYQLDGDGVGVIIARGTILDGSHPPGTIGGDSTAALVRKARLDDQVKAVVLRVDSGGGSAFASEVIRRELELVREAGKPVVVSMGSVAASGGYWIATASDEIWANPTTLTGSIGIFGMFPTFEEPLAEYLGTRVDGVGTTWLAGALRPDRALDPRVGQLIQLNIERGYRDFLERVGEARNMDPAEVDPIAQGRVWSGIDALEIGLVDQLGDLDEAIVSAAQMAELGDDYAVRTIDEEVDFKDQLLIDMLSRTTAWFGPLDPGFGLFEPKTRLERQLLDVVDRHRQLLSGFDDPNGVYAHCLCEIE